MAEIVEVEDFLAGTAEEGGCLVAVMVEVEECLVETVVEEEETVVEGEEDMVVEMVVEVVVAVEDNTHHILCICIYVCCKISRSIKPCHVSPNLYVVQVHSVNCAHETEH